jgi:carbonic anhydrase/acetyltransferase-like protein (isoleucine patch superfamily)
VQGEVGFSSPELRRARTPGVSLKLGTPEAEPPSGRVASSDPEPALRGETVLFDSNIFRGLGLFSAGLILGWGVASFGSFPEAPQTAASVQGVPHVGASNRWAQHEPAREYPAAGQHGVAFPSTRGGMLRPNVPTDFNPDIETPRIGTGVYLDPMASVIGNVHIGSRVYIAPFASVRGDEGQPIFVGNESNLQDGVVLHALETVSNGKPVPSHTYEVQGHRYAIYVGHRVSLAHQAQVHGPAYVEDDVFVGMQALVFKSHIGKGSVIEPAAAVIGVDVPPGRYVPAGATLTDQAAADRLPKITGSYAMRETNRAVVHVNTALADAYSGRSAPAHVAPHD